MTNHYNNTPDINGMQSTVETIRADRGTVNAYSKARHSGMRQYLTAKQWDSAQGGSIVIQPGRHKGARKWVEGYELVCGVGSGYVAIFATAHKASDLYAWACLNGYPAESLYSKSPCLRRMNTA